MPDITLRYTQSELEEFVRQMLAAKGLRPKDDIIRFSPRTVNGEMEAFDVFIDCVPGPMLDRCPVCQTRLIDGAPVPEKVQAVPAPALPRDYPAEDRDYPVEVQDPSAIDPELGETFDPPSPNEGAPSVTVSNPDGETPSEGGGSMTSLMALNKRLTAERERELAVQRRSSGGSRMPGESSRPPQPDKGN